MTGPLFACAGGDFLGTAATGFGAGSGGGFGADLREKSDLRLSGFLAAATGLAGVAGGCPALTGLAGETDFFTAGAGTAKGRVAGFFANLVLGTFGGAAEAGWRTSTARIAIYRRLSFTPRE